jgi:hypothetical protein
LKGGNNMKLDNDCIRDILLYIEEVTTDKLPFVSVDSLKSELKKYSSDTINFHIRQIDQAKLVDAVGYGDGVPQDISNLSWEGNAFIANIRDDKVWSKVKSLTKGLASISIQILNEYAKIVIMNHLPKS